MRFLGREFAGHWRVDFEDFLRLGGRISDYMLLWTERGIDGFCKLTFVDSAQPIERYYPYGLPQPWGQLGPSAFRLTARHGLWRGHHGRGDAAFGRGRSRRLSDRLDQYRGFLRVFGFAPHRQYLGASSKSLARA